MFRNLLKEQRRSNAVRSLGLADGVAEPAFERFVEQAASAFDAPIALMSLIHGDGQWFKAGRGIAFECLSRQSGFCSFALDRPDLLEVCAPETDARFAKLPVVVGDPHVRYYIGAPLRLKNGIDVGVLCVVDMIRRDPATPDQRAYLLGLARQATMALETRTTSWRGQTAGRGTA